MANITERKNKDGVVISYRIRVSRGYAPDGKKRKPYEMTWRPAPGMSKRAAKKEAERQALQFEEQCKTGFSGDVSRITLTDFIPIYLEQKKPALSPGTYDFYQSEIEKKILPALGHHRLKEIKPIHVQEFINQLCEIPNQNHPEQKLSPETIKRILTILQSIFKLAVKRRILSENPARAERLDIPKATKPKIDIFSKQEAADMLEALEKEPLQFQVLIQLALMTGARRGELVALQFSDFDAEENKMTIQKAAIKLTGEQAQIKPPKDYETRSVSISPNLMQLVQALQQEKRQQRRIQGTKWKEGDWLFTKNNGEMINPQTPTRQFSKFLKRNGFPHRKFHALRHTSATLLLYGGVSLKQVQGRLGHGSIETTSKYLHCMSGADEEATGTLQAMIFEKKDCTLIQKQA